MPEIGCYVGRNRTYAATADTWVTVPWDIEYSDTDGMHDYANPTRITVRDTGLWLVMFCPLGSDSISSTLQSRLKINGASFGGVCGHSNFTPLPGITQWHLIELAENDYLEMEYFRGSATSSNPNVGGFFMAVLIELSACSLTDSTTVSPSGWATVDFDTEVYDPDGMHSSGDPSIITVNESGWWIVMTFCTRSGTGQTRVLLNGSDTGIKGGSWTPSIAGAGNLGNVDFFPVDLTAGDELQMQVNAGSGTYGDFRFAAWKMDERFLVIVDEIAGSPEQPFDRFVPWDADVRDPGGNHTLGATSIVTFSPIKCLTFSKWKPETWGFVSLTGCWPYKNSNRDMGPTQIRGNNASVVTDVGFGLFDLSANDYVEMYSLVSGGGFNVDDTRTYFMATVIPLSASFAPQTIALEMFFGEEEEV